MQIPVEVTPKEMLDLLGAIYVDRKAYPSVSADIPDLVRSAFLAGLSTWQDDVKG